MPTFVNASLCAIVLNYRNAALTRRCLLSLVGQGVDLVRLVDNSDCERSFEQLDAMLCEIKLTVDFPVTLSRPKHNLGFAGGVNLAIQDDFNSHHELYLLLNNDAVLFRNAVSELRRTAAILSNGLLFSPKCASIGAPDRMWYQRYIGLLSKNHIPGGALYLTGACLLINRKCIRDGVLFDPDFFMYGEDVELSWRLLRQYGDTAVNLLNVALYWHEPGGSSVKGGWFYEYHSARAHWLLIKKLVVFEFEWVAIFPIKSAYILLRAIVRACKFRSLIPVRAAFAAFEI